MMRPWTLGGPCTEFPRWSVVYEALRVLSCILRVLVCTENLRILLPVFTAPPSHPTPPPAIRRFPKRMLNICQHGWLPIIVGQPSLAMDKLVFAYPQSPESATLDPYSDGNTTFESVAGGPVCASDHDGTPNCDGPTGLAPALGMSDAICVECPIPRSSSPGSSPPCPSDQLGCNVRSLFRSGVNRAHTALDTGMSMQTCESPVSSIRCR